jgi:hypothetical protein
MAKNTSFGASGASAKTILTAVLSLALASACGGSGSATPDGSPAASGGVPGGPDGGTGGTTATATGGLTGSSGSGGQRAGSGGAASGGATGSGGVSPRGSGGAASGGATGAGGTGGRAVTGSGGSSGSGGATASGGAPGVAGSAGHAPGGTASGGKTGMGGAGTGGSATGGTTSSGGNSGSGGLFGCSFAWGEPTPAKDSWLQFVTNWAGQSVQANGDVTSCETCSWLSQLASTNLIPVYYAYIIGFYGHVNGLPDGNQTSGANLTTGGGALILGAANAACPAGQLCAQNKIVEAYAYYAKQSHAAWPTKPLIWLLEGDYVQYAASAQSKPLTYDQLGQLAALITTAIKSNMPNAIVAMDHSTWNSDDVTNSFWNAMKQAHMDLVWTTGVGNANGFLATGTTASSYNGKTATYSYLHTLTGMKILVDESAGLSQQSDTWSNQTAATINARIAEGVIGINVSGAPSTYQSNVASLGPHLNSTCP